MDPKNSRILLIIVLLLVAAAAFFIVRSVHAPTEVACQTDAMVCPDGTAVGRIGPQCSFSACPTTSTPVDVPQRVTLQGEYICLPHKDTSGPQTEECAAGLKTDDGSYYALDLSVLETDALSGGPSRATITVSGILVPIEQISSNRWQIYPIKGVMQVTSL